MSFKVVNLNRMNAIIKHFEETHKTPARFMVIEEGKPLHFEGFKNPDEAIGFFTRQFDRLAVPSELGGILLDFANKFKPGGQSKDKRRFAIILEDSISLNGFTTVDEAIGFLTYWITNLSQEGVIHQIRKRFFDNFPEKREQQNKYTNGK